MSLESLRERNKGGKLDKLLKAAGKTSLGNKTTNNDQEETYYPERDKEGNGSCIIRFLPGLVSEDEPYYIERFQHGFQANNKWFIEFCPKTIKKDCPVCDDNWDIMGEYGGYKDCPKNVQTIINERGYNKGFRSGNYCNVLVIKDPKNPENEGKVHLFSFGKGIMNLIMGMAQPADDGLGAVPDPVDVFDLVAGANFKFIIFKKDGRADYSKSCFEAPSKCPDFDVDSQIPLLPLTDEKLFKSYDDLQAQLNKVLQKTNPNVAKTADDAVNESSSSSGGNVSDEATGSVSEPTDNVDAGDEGDDNMAYFQGIADEVNI